MNFKTDLIATVLAFSMGACETHEPTAPLISPPPVTPQALHSARMSPPPGTNNAWQFIEVHGLPKPWVSYIARNDMHLLRLFVQKSPFRLVTFDDSGRKIYADNTNVWINGAQAPLQAPPGLVVPYIENFARHYLESFKTCSMSPKQPSSEGLSNNSSSGWKKVVCANLSGTPLENFFVIQRPGVGGASGDVRRLTASIFGYQVSVQLLPVMTDIGVPAHFETHTMQAPSLSGPLAPLPLTWRDIHDPASRTRREQQFKDGKNGLL